MFLSFLLYFLFTVRGQEIQYGDDYNGTHVLIDNRYFPVVDCKYENNSNNKYVPFFPTPKIDYESTLIKQSFFRKIDDNEYERYSCSNTNAKCSCKNDKKYALGYRCDCPYSTSFFYKIFNDETKLFEGRCEEFSTLCGHCHPRNTFKCIILNATAVRCQCIKGYEPSSNCYEKYNACEKAPEGSTLSGNEACKIKEKNQCLASIGFQKYLCQCFYPNKEDYNIGFPNCMGKKVKKCDSILCINGGECDSSVIGQCICKKGYSGKYCEIIQYKYIGSWISWSSCYPECGNYGVRSSDSVCNGPISVFCSGVIRKWERCSAISCGLIFLSSVQNKSIHGLRYYLAQMLSLTKEESIKLFFVLYMGGFATGLLYILINELFL